MSASEPTSLLSKRTSPTRPPVLMAIHVAQHHLLQVIKYVSLTCHYLSSLSCWSATQRPHDLHIEPPYRVSLSAISWWADFLNWQEGSVLSAAGDLGVGLGHFVAGRHGRHEYTGLSGMLGWGS